MSQDHIILSVNHVAYSVGRHRRRAEILRDITFDLRQGDSIAVMGPSGVGKTTLCRLMAGLAAPVLGEIAFHDRPLVAPSSAITISFQHYPCFPWLTVEANALFGVKAKDPSGLARDREYVGWLLTRLGLGGVRGHLPRELSGGMQQRLSLARSLAVRPEVLILDEPFSALDPATKDDLKDLLQHLQTEMKFTLVVVLHDLLDAFSVTQRAIVLRGRPAGMGGDIRVSGLAFEEFKRLVLDASGRTAERTHSTPLRRDLTDLALASGASS